MSTSVRYEEEREEHNDGLTDEFIAKYLKDEVRVINFKRWKSFSVYGWIFNSISILILSAIVDTGGLVLSADLAIVGSVFMLTLFLSTMFSLSHRRSDLDLFDVRYHDVAYAVDQYQNGNYDKTTEKLVEIKHNRSDYLTLSDKRKSELKEYIQTVEEKDEEYLKNTFDHVFSKVIFDLTWQLEDHLIEPPERDQEEQELPSAYNSIVSAIDMDYLRDPTVIWAFLCLSSLGAIGVAYWIRIEWGLLIVPIVFGVASLLKQDSN